ncbi:M56 family metallopeptidase [Actinomadura oligospora]|uniref:M56 family metallopeptidase n=1 Tax=Actinomadura oligospora TaxID=111804 RepID=UPI00047D2373|nr:M56 family metallopeptidase [Actinomadura oligospora]
MTDPDTYLALLLPAVAALAARPLSGRLAPRTATWLLTGTAVALAVASLATLAVSALGSALRLAPIAALGHMSEAVLRRAPRTDPVYGTAAAVLLTLCLVAVACVAVRQGYRLVASARTARSLPGDGLVAIVDDPEAEAFALPGRPGRVVVTTGMLDVLTSAQRAALIAHERAHLADRHHLFRALTTVAVAANPLLWPLRAAVVFATERWADERAAASIDDREQTAQAIGRAALAHNRRPRLGHAAALGIGIGVGFGRDLGVGVGRAARRFARRPGPLPRRVAALLEPPPARRPLLIAALLGLVLVSLLAAQDAAFDLHELIEHAQAAA